MLCWIWKIRYARNAAELMGIGWDEAAEIFQTTRINNDVLKINRTSRRIDERTTLIRKVEREKERERNKSTSSRSIRMLLDLASYFAGWDLYFLIQQVLCLYPHCLLLIGDQLVNGSNGRNWGHRCAHRFCSDSEGASLRCFYLNSSFCLTKYVADKAYSDNRFASFSRDTG